MQLIKQCPFCSNKVRVVRNKKYGIFKGWHAIVGFHCYGCGAKVRFDHHDIAKDDWDLDTDIRCCEEKSVELWNKRE